MSGVSSFASLCLLATFVGAPVGIASTTISLIFPAPAGNGIIKMYLKQWGEKNKHKNLFCWLGISLITERKNIAD